MKTIKQSIALLALVAPLTLVPTTALAHGNSGDSAHIHAPAEKESISSRKSDAILADMEAIADSLDVVIDMGALKRVHDLAQPLLTLGKELKEASKANTKNQAQRIAGGVKNLTTLADHAHDHADEGKAVEAKADVKKIRSQIKLLIQQTKDSVKKGATHETHH